MAKKKTQEEIRMTLEGFLQDTPHLTLLDCDLGNGTKSRLNILCRKHGVTWSPEYRHFIDGHINCPSCKKDTVVKTKRMTDETITKRLTETGFFKEGSIFKRNNDLSDTQRSVVDVFCPVCAKDPAGEVKSVFPSLLSNLLRGQIPCRCAKRRVWEEEELFCFVSHVLIGSGLSLKKLLGTKMQDKAVLECDSHGEIVKSIRDVLHQRTGCPKCAGLDHNIFYVHGVYDRDTLVGLKYGITKSNTQSPRLYQQNKASLYEIRPLFSITMRNPRYLESYLKKILPPVFTKREVPDGYTETCGAEHLDYITSLAKEGASH